MVYFKENSIFLGSRGGPTFYRGGGPNFSRGVGGGANVNRTCEFSGGPDLWIRACV